MDDATRARALRIAARIEKDDCLDGSPAAIGGLDGVLRGTRDFEDWALTELETMRDQLTALQCAVSSAVDGVNSAYGNNVAGDAAKEALVDAGIAHRCHGRELSDPIDSSVGLDGRWNDPAKED